MEEKWNKGVGADIWTQVGFSPWPQLSLCDDTAQLRHPQNLSMRSRDAGRERYV